MSGAGGAKVKIRFDGENAMRGLRALGRAARRAGQAVRGLDSTAVSARGLGASLAGMARTSAAVGLGAIGASAATEVLAKALRAGTESVRQYIDAEEGRKEIAAGVSEAMGKMSMAFGEAIAGGGNLELISNALGDTFAIFQRIIEDNKEEIQRFTRGAVRMLIQGLRGLNMLVIGLKATWAGLEIAFLAGKALFFELAAVTHEMTQAMRELANDALQFVIDKFVDLAETVEPAISFLDEDLGAALRNVTQDAAGFGEQFEQTTERLAEQREEMSRLARVARDDAADAITRVNRELIESVEGNIQLDIELRRVVETMGEAGEAQARYRGQVERTTSAVRAQAEETVDRFARVREFMQRLGERALELQAEQKTAMMVAIEDELRKSEAAAERHERIEEKKRRAVEATMQARKDYVDQALGAAEQFVAGEGKIADRAKKALGQGIVDAGRAGLARASIMFFTPGMQGAAAGLTAASLAAIALGGKFGASGGRGGGGRGGGGRSATVTQNITFGGGVGGQDRRSIARSIERASRDGVLAGMGAA